MPKILLAVLVTVVTGDQCQGLVDMTRIELATGSLQIYPPPSARP
jgi:hypothetical protein